MRSYFFWVASHPVAALVLAALLCLPFFFFLSEKSFEGGADAFVPPGFPALAKKREVDERFHLREPIVVSVVRDAPGGVFTPETLRLVRDLTKAIQGLTDPKDVYSIATECGVYFIGGQPGFEPLLKDIPEKREDLDALEKDILGYELYNGTIVSSHSKAACIIIRTKGDETSQVLYAKLVDLLTAFPRKDERILVAGDGAIRAVASMLPAAEAWRVSTASLILAAAVALLVVVSQGRRRLRARAGLPAGGDLAVRLIALPALGAVLAFAVVCSSAAVALGLMSLFGAPGGILSACVLPALVALRFCDPLILETQLLEALGSRGDRTKVDAIAETCRGSLGLSGAIALFEIAGLLILWFFGVFPPVRHFGLFTAAGVVASLVLTFTVVPAALSLVPLRQGAASSGTTAADADVDAAAGATVPETRLCRSWLLPLGGFLFVALAILGPMTVRVDDDRLRFLERGDPLVSATKEINACFDGLSTLNIAVTAKESQAFLRPEMVRKVEALEAFTESLPGAGGTHSLSGWVKRAHQKMNGEDPAFYAIPKDPAEIQFYLDVLRTSGSTMSRQIEEVIDPTYTKANLIVRMREGSYAFLEKTIPRIVEYLEREFADGAATAELAGQASVDRSLFGLILPAHRQCFPLALAAAFILATLALGHAERGLLGALAVAVGVFLTYSQMVFAGYPFGLVALLVPALGVGAGMRFPLLHGRRAGRGVALEFQGAFLAAALFGFFALDATRCRMIGELSFLLGLSCFCSVLSASAICSRSGLSGQS